MASGAVTQLTGVLSDRIAGYRGGRAKAEMASKDAESNENSIVGCEIRVVWESWEYWQVIYSE
jgi:hypothetical protein